MAQRVREWMPRVGRNWLGKVTYDNPFPTWRGLPSFTDGLRLSMEISRAPKLPPEEELERLLPVLQPNFSVENTHPGISFIF